MKTTTFRLSLCALLIFGITAKPHVPLGKLAIEEIQETVSKYDTKKEHVEVEPKDYRVNPEVRALYSEPEKDEDDVYHGDNQYSAVQTDSEQKASEDSAVRLYLEPEEDEDDLYHKDVQLHIQSDP